MSIFGKKKGPRTIILEFQQKFRTQQRKIDREIRSLDAQMKKTELLIKQNYKKGQPEAGRILAKEYAQARKARTRLYMAHAELDSISMTLSQQMSTNAVIQGLGNVTGIMQSMQKIVSLPQIRQDMMQISKEMYKMDMINEMVTDTIDDTMGVDDTVVDDEVENVINELTKDAFKDAPVIKDSIPAAVRPAEPLSDTASNVVDQIEADDEALRSRLATLLNE